MPTITLRPDEYTVDLGEAHSIVMQIATLDGGTINCGSAEEAVRQWNEFVRNWQAEMHRDSIRETLEKLNDAFKQWGEQTARAMRDMDWRMFFSRGWYMRTDPGPAREPHHMHLISGAHICRVNKPTKANRMRNGSQSRSIATAHVWKPQRNR